MYWARRTCCLDNSCGFLFHFSRFVAGTSSVFERAASINNLIPASAPALLSSRRSRATIGHQRQPIGARYRGDAARRVVGGGTIGDDRLERRRPTRRVRQATPGARRRPVRRLRGRPLRISSHVHWP